MTAFPSYTYAHGQIFTPDGIPLTALAICFDSDSGTLLKHGEAEAVQAYAKTTRSKLQGAGCDDWALVITVVQFSACNAETFALLEKAISRVGWLQRWYTEQINSSPILTHDAPFLADVTSSGF